MKRIRRNVHARVALALVTLAALVATTPGSARASAAPETPTARASHVASAAHRARLAARRVPRTAPRLAMRAFVDPATGRLSSHPKASDAPGEAPAPALGAATASGAAPATSATNTLPVTTLDDGTRLVKLGPEQMEYEVARVGKDGKLIRACVHGEHAAADFRANKEDR